MTTVEFLLLNGAKVDIRDNNGQGPLHHATQLGHTGYCIQLANILHIIFNVNAVISVLSIFCLHAVCYMDFIRHKDRQTEVKNTMYTITAEVKTDVCIKYLCCG